jgi:Icc-related predicted phosphoesterase
MEESGFPSTVKTRFLILSDTHSKQPFDSSDTEHAYRSPLPQADVLLHAGDLTMSGMQEEYQTQLEMLTEYPAELKIVIPGNHDITLDEPYYASHTWKHEFAEDVVAIKAMWTGPEARKAGIVLLEENVQSFELKNGAKFTVYASAYQPEFFDYAFGYERDEDRFNPPSLAQKLMRVGAANPVPSHPKIDIMLTHGPPFGILDDVRDGPFGKSSVGCKHLLRAVKRCRPRLHAFGHIHEGWGAEMVTWATENKPPVEDKVTPALADKGKTFEERSAHIDISSSGGRELRFGQETLFVNASIMNVRYNPRNAPWIVDLDLPKG